ncbi:MAG: glycine cleavage system aminomethyltransferase GcvT [Planctomycetota bacterium]|jgi:glycine hydroxymethyltransferase
MSNDASAIKEVFNFDLPELPIRKTVLNEAHKALGAKMVPFAGWEMPVQYETGIFAEHKAVRTAAGLFDVSHMGVFEVMGSDAEAFLNSVLTNDIASLKPGKAQYNYILKPDGRGLDDSFLYRFSGEKFMLVVNAANAEKDWAWLEAVKSGQYIIDNGDSSRTFTGDVSLRNLRDVGEDSLIDLAFQGPLSKEILAGLSDSDTDKEKIEAVGMNSIAEVSVAGIKIILTGTGYTGENTGFEIYVHPDNAVKLWNTILETGKDKGVLPIGLGARDSLRIEAGFPLFGHELEGDDKISITEAGYGFAVKAEVDFFIGKAPYLTENDPRTRKILRVHGKGSKSLREGHILINEEGAKIATVTSFAFLDKDKNFIIMALADFSTKIKAGEQVKGYRAAEVDQEKGIDEQR